MLHKIITFLLFCVFASHLVAQCPGPSQRQALLNLQRAIVVEGTRAGQIGLTDTCGNQGYAQYVEVNLDTIAYTPTETGNTQNLSEFVIDPTGALFYIDWQGNSVQFAGGAATCDTDWLQISDNSCPDAITDSIYKQKYAAVGARYVWPGAQFLVNDSTAAGIAVVQGSRNARLALYDGQGGTFLMIDHGGSTPIVYFPVGANMIFKTTGGTPQTPVGSQVNHFAINSQDSTIQAHQYPNTRVDTQAVLNLLYTDSAGKFRSTSLNQIVDSVLSSGNGIYGGSGNVPDGTVATMLGSFSISGGGGGQILGLGDASFSNGGNGFLVRADNNAAMGDIFGLNDYYVIAGTGAGGVYHRSPASNLIQGPVNTDWTIATGEFDISDSRVTKKGVEYTSSAYGAGFTDATLIHRAYAAQMISDSLAAAGGGTVTSVGLSLPAIFSVSGSPVTTSGTLTGSLATQSANTIFAGPATGAAAAPTFRSLVAADLPAGAGGAWLDGGNTFGATGTLGTNDNNTVAFETNNVTRGTISSGASTGGAWTMTDVTANTNTVEDVLTIRANSTGTPTTNYGVGLLFQGKSSTTDNRDMGRIVPYWISATDGARSAYIGVEMATAGGGMQRYAVFENSNSGALSLGTASAATFHRAGINTQASFLIGNSSSSVTLGGSSGVVSLVSANASASAINFNPNQGGATGTGGVSIAAGQSYNQTSGTRSILDHNAGFAPTSGTAVHNSMLFSGTFNQTGGANGITRGIYLNQTITAVADMRLIELAANGSNTKGIYQTGSSVTNNFVGATAFGSTTAPGTAVDVVGTTSTEHLIGQNLTPAIAVNTGGAGTGATASVTNAQSSDLAGRFSISSGTGATTGLWATVTFDDAFSVTPVVQVYNEDADASNLKHYVNVNTTSFEFFVNGGQTDTTSYDFNFIIIGGK